MYMTAPKHQRTKADLVYEALQSSIMSGNIREGEHLRQEEVAARLGVSQTPVREAFRRLEAKDSWSTRRTGASSSAASPGRPRRRRSMSSPAAGANS